MNSKRTNYIVAILSAISILSVYLLNFTSNFLMQTMMRGNGITKSLYNSLSTEFLLMHIETIMITVQCVVGILSIICSIQNKNNKKLFFWFLVFGLIEIWMALSINILYEFDFEEILSEIIYAIPIVFAIINFIRIKKNTPNRIQVVSYVATIIISILNILQLVYYIWDIVAIGILIIYIHNQDTENNEIGTKKILSIILYYVIESLIVLGFFFLVITALLSTKINEAKHDKGLNEIYNKVSTLQGNTNKELYIPVDNNNKFGYINESGKEVIPCEYDKASPFNEITCNNNVYYIALVSQGNKYYIISKDNERIEIEGGLDKILNRMNEYLWEKLISSMNRVSDKRCAYVQSFQFFLSAFTKSNESLNMQLLDNNSNSLKTISLEDYDDYFTYINENYKMKIEPIYETEDDEEYYDDDSEFYKTNKCKVTINKDGNEIYSDSVYLPDLDTRFSTIKSFSDGSILFYSLDGKYNGFFDSFGNNYLLPINYEIYNIIEDRIMLRYLNVDENGKPKDNYEEDDSLNQNNAKFYLMDKNGKILIETPALALYENFYLLMNKNKKMVLVNKDLKEISKEYDRIITSTSVDISQNFSSYK